MKTATEINAEIKQLQAALAIPGRWNAATKHQLQESIKILEKRMTPKQVEDTYYVDETSDEYRDGDNLLWTELDLVANWMTGHPDYDPPSKGLL